MSIAHPDWGYCGGQFLPSLSIMGGARRDESRLAGRADGREAQSCSRKRPPATLKVGVRVLFEHRSTALLCSTLRSHLYCRTEVLVRLVRARSTLPHWGLPLHSYSLTQDGVTANGPRRHLIWATRVGQGPPRAQSATFGLFPLRSLIYRRVLRYISPGSNPISPPIFTNHHLIFTSRLLPAFF